MSAPICSNPKLSENWRAFLMGEATIIVTLKDGSVHNLDYFVSEDYICGYMEKNHPHYLACAAFHATYNEHKEKCAACKAREMAQAQKLMSPMT